MTDPEAILREAGAARRAVGQRILEDACRRCGAPRSRHLRKKGVACARCGGELKLRTFYGKKVTIVEGPNAGMSRAYCDGLCGFDGLMDADTAAHLRRGRGTGVAV